MNVYQKRFVRVLEAANDEVADKEALAATLDPGTKPTDFDVQNVPNLTTKDVLKQSYEQQANELQQWINKIQEFVEYINGETQESIQTKLHSAGCDTMFEKIASSETKKISRVASELSALVQSFKGYLISNMNT